jgi:RNA polymerase sigma factor (sigma-70 family)
MMSVVIGGGEPEYVVVVEDVAVLFRNEGRRLLGMLTAYLGDRAEAEDVLQDAFARVQRAWPRIEHRGSAPAYLRSTAFNLARSSLRRRRRRPDPVAAMPAGRDLEPAADGPSLDDGLTLREDQREVLAALGALPTRQRACVVLRYYGEHGIEEISDTLGISPNSVKTHLRRAMASLHEALESSR